ncbi:hypothetical protein [Streptomyces sp. NPDC051677]|uniref:DUF7848 domain-containing protein n=1 Tax=Streptomyces sp. NPDC051677 TaxID=3365669 RepID=UPI0037CD0B54
MTRAVYRFVDYKVRLDETAHAEFSAVCVTGDEADCGAFSGVMVDDERVTRWIAEHCRDTGHARFKRTYSDYATVARNE